jgi:hypothetical protein
MHRRSLERFPFDSVLLPLNYTMLQNQAYSAEYAELVDMCRQRGVAIQTIKSLAVGDWGEKERMTRTWYEALSEQSDVDLAVHWVLGQEGVFLNSSSDLGLLEKIVDAAERYEVSPSGADMEAMASRTAMSPLFT